MIYGKIFFLVNSKLKVDLLEKDSIFLFGPIHEFRNKILQLYSNTISDDNGVLAVKKENTVIKFFYGTEDIIEKFVIAEVLYSDEPYKDMFEICSKNGWHLFDLESESYIQFENV